MKDHGVENPLPKRHRDTPLRDIKYSGTDTAQARCRVQHCTCIGVEKRRINGIVIAIAADTRSSNRGSNMFLLLDKLHGFLHESISFIPLKPSISLEVSTLYQPGPRKAYSSVVPFVIISGSRNANGLTSVL